MTNNLRGIRKGLCAFAKKCKGFKYTDSALITFLITGAVSVSSNLFSAEKEGNIENQKQILSTDIKDFNVLLKEARKENNKNDTRFRNIKSFITYYDNKTGSITLKAVAINMRLNARWGYREIGSWGYNNSRFVRQNGLFIQEWFKNNEITALVGKSGSGKSTVMSLIARFWDTTKGSIKIGGKDIKEVNPDSLLKNISMVFQDVYFYCG